MSGVEQEAVLRLGGSGRAEGLPARDYFEAALLAAFRGLEAALAAFQKDASPDHVHELRVAARKLRGIAALIRQLAPSHQIASLSRQAKSLAKAVAVARELDVLHAALRRHPEADNKSEAVERLAQHLFAAREKACHNASAAIGAAVLPSPAFMTRRQNGASRQQLRALDSMERRAARAPAAEIAARLLGRLAHRVAKRSRNIRSMGAGKRHDLRIAVKNLRYATETFAVLFAGDPRLARYLERLIRFQEVLGICNDARAARMRLRPIVKSEGRTLRKAAKGILAAQKKEGRKAVTRLKRRSRKLRHAEPFWLA